MKKIKLLMIDNYDSFTYNIVQYFGELGADIEVFRNDEISLAGIAQRNPDRLVISPGPCSPAEAGISVAAIQHFAGKLPILGVCLGHQSIGAAFGGSPLFGGLQGVVPFRKTVSRQDRALPAATQGFDVRALRALRMAVELSLRKGSDRKTQAGGLEPASCAAERGLRRCLASQRAAGELMALRLWPGRSITAKGRVLTMSRQRFHW